MATITPTITFPCESSSDMAVTTWDAMAAGDDGQPVRLAVYSDRSVQVSGTFGGTVLQAPLLENTSTPYAPGVGVGAVALGPPLLTNSSTLYTPTVAATGPQTLEPPLLANASTLFAPTVGGVLPLSDAEMRHMYELVQELHASMAGCGGRGVVLIRRR